MNIIPMNTITMNIFFHGSDSAKSLSFWLWNDPATSMNENDSTSSKTTCDSVLFITATIWLDATTKKATTKAVIASRFLLGPSTIFPSSVVYFSMP